MYCVCVCVCDPFLLNWPRWKSWKKTTSNKSLVATIKANGVQKAPITSLIHPPFSDSDVLSSLFVCLAVCTRLRCAYNFSFSSWLYSRVYSDLEHMRCPGCTARGGHSVQQLSSCASALPSPPSFFFFCNWVNLVWWKKQISKRKYGGKWKKTRGEKYI